MTAPSSFLAELKRRKVFRVAVVYVATAFLVLQAADIMLPRLGVPDWALSFLVVLVVLGLPIALVMAWALELTPEGVKVTRGLAASDPAEPAPSLLGGRTLALAGILVALGVGLGTGWILKPAGTGSPTAAAAIGGVDASAGSDAGDREADESIAVLAFADLSPEGDQGYFADGIAEEILNALVRIEGLRVAGRTSSFHDAGTTGSRRRMDRFIVAGLVVVIAIMGAERIWFAGGEAPSPSDAPGEISIGVLAFANMSEDPENEHFADGISEEILNILAGIEGLRVASRTSAFSFKGQGAGIPEIARALNVSHVLEGSVRRQGGRVRITAQLIRADTDGHLWSQAYDRDLTDIFQVQEEIARAITGALEDVLGTRRVVVEASTDDLEVYDRFLRGRALFHRRTEIDGAIEDLRWAVERDPGFGEAWTYLAAAYHVAPGYATEISSRAAVMKVRRRSAVPAASPRRIRWSWRSRETYGPITATSPEASTSFAGPRACARPIPLHSSGTGRACCWPAMRRRRSKCWRAPPQWTPCRA